MTNSERTENRCGELIKSAKEDLKMAKRDKGGGYGINLSKRRVDF